MVHNPHLLAIGQGKAALRLHGLQHDTRCFLVTRIGRHQLIEEGSSAGERVITHDCRAVGMLVGARCSSLRCNCIRRVGGLRGLWLLDRLRRLGSLGLLDWLLDGRSGQRGLDLLNLRLDRRRRRRGLGLLDDSHLPFKAIRLYDCGPFAGIATGWL